MVETFAEHSNRATRALQAWLILTARARNRQTLTYSMLDEMMCFGSPIGLTPILKCILNYCQVNSLPPLTIIVVNKSTGIPSSGIGEFDFSQQEAVFNFDWYSIFPPTVEELDAALRDPAAQ